MPGYVEWCKNCDFFSRIYVFGMLGPRGPLGGAKTVPPSVGFHCLNSDFAGLRSHNIDLLQRNFVEF